MGEVNDKNSGLLDHDGEGAALLPAPASAIETGSIWKLMGFIWRFPNWHGAWLRGEKKGLLTYRKADAGQPETVLAARTLDELRGMIVAIINCGRLHRTDAAEPISGYRKFCLTVQTVFGTNKRSLALHDRVSMIPSMSGLLEHDCVICAMFHTFREFVLTRTLDDQCGTPNDWALALTEGGNAALLELLRRFESIGIENGIGTVRAEDLRRFPSFVAGLTRIALPTGVDTDTPTIAAVQPTVEPPKKEDAADKNLTVNVAVYNQIPVNVSQQQKAVAVGDAVATNESVNQGDTSQPQKLEDAAETTTGNTAADDSQEDVAKTREPADTTEDGITNTATADSQDSATEAREPEDKAKDAATDTVTADNQGDVTKAQKPEGTAGADTDNTATATDDKAKKKRHQGFRTTAAMQYYTLRVLFDLYCEDSETTIRAAELCKRIRKIQIDTHKVVLLDEQYCHAAINDLRKRFRHESVEAQISKGQYRLLLGHYGRKSEIEKLLAILKNAMEI